MLIRVLTAPLLLLFALAVACSDGDEGAPVGGASVEGARNATYRTEFVRSGEVTLVDGEHREAAAPGSASQIVIAVQQTAIGDLDGDGTDDAAVILTSSGGGSGTFFTLEALISADGGLVNVAGVLLGDRIRVTSVSIDDREVFIDLLVRPDGMPFAQPPSQAKTVRYVLASDELVLSSPPERAVDVCDNEDGGLDGAVVFVTSPLSGSRVSSGFAVEGCSRTFEGTVNWALYDRTGAPLADGFTSGGGSDGPASFWFEVTYSLSALEVGRLDVFAPDPSGGEGFPPPRDVVPLVLLP